LRMEHSCGRLRRLLELRSPKLPTRARFLRLFGSQRIHVAQGGEGGRWQDSEPCQGGVAGRRRPGRSPYVHLLTSPRTFGKLSGSRRLRRAAAEGDGQVSGNAGESIRIPRFSVLDPGSEPH
jgi:hypothetical protein